MLPSDRRLFALAPSYALADRPTTLPSVLVGPKKFIERAKWFRKAFGGGIRQSGGLAAAANYCLDNHLPLLAGTHTLAAYLAGELADLGVHLMLPVETSE